MGHNYTRLFRQDNAWELSSDGLLIRAGLQCPRSPLQSPEQVAPVGHVEQRNITLLCVRTSRVSAYKGNALGTLTTNFGVQPLWSIHLGEL